MTAQEQAPRLRPVYVVAFESTSATVPGIESLPVLPLSPGIVDGTRPHGLDTDLMEALPALWYCLQLPRTKMDLTDWPSASALLLSHWLGVAHRIVLLPLEHIAVIDKLNERYVPALVFCPDRFVDAIAPTVARAGFAAGPIAFSSLTDRSLAEHWQAVAGAFGVPPPVDAPTALVRRLDLAGVNLPLRQLSRAFGDAAGEVEDPVRLSDAMWNLLGWRAQLQAFARRGLEDVGNVELSDEEVREHLRQAKFPVCLVAPGVATRYARRAYSSEQVASFGTFDQFDPQDVWTAVPPAGDEAAERSALEFVATYAAVSRDGVALTLPAIPAEAWNLLNMLERHLVDNDGDGKPWKVRNLLQRLDVACAPLWSDHVLDALKGAASVRAVSNFPLGLLTPPGHEVPIASLVPVVQQPATPLTRLVQRAVDGLQGIDLSGGVNVLVAECIPEADLAGRISRGAFEQVADLLRSTSAKVSLTVVDASSAAEVRGAIAQHRPQMLVVSAHGIYPDDGSMSGLNLGDGYPSLGWDLGDVPPVVLLSACSTAPRGDGAPTVTDLLLRQGALAVLGAQVPVNAYRNAVLMGRLLVNINLSLSGENGDERLTTLLDVWDHTQTTNLINDIVTSNVKLRQWAHTPRSGLPPPLVDFMNGSGTQVPLRRDSFYRDTIERLLVVADQSSDRDRVKAWMIRGFVPETAFYQFVGEPERVLLRTPPAIILADSVNSS